MRVMVFIDFDNFKASIRCINNDRKQNRIIDFYKINKFVIDYLEGNPQYESRKLVHVRTYFYTGEYSESILNRMKFDIAHTDGDKKLKLEKFSEWTKQKKEKQKDFFKKLHKYHFFEVRIKPLQYSKDKGIFQKGIDVQIAVDLVSNAYLDNYDIAVLFSGDIDLLEPIRTVKNLGKNVIIISHIRNIAKEMAKDADYFIDCCRLHDNTLSKFTHEYENKKDVGNKKSKA